jgi:lipopolysaccharide cholinephosphotransferase
MNSLTKDSRLRVLTDEEILKLRKCFLEAFQDLNDCCEKYSLHVMLIGGSTLGAVRHKGFIPWDDDLDVAMTRSDFEKLKEVFEIELGEKYILSSPNYKNNAKNRFPMMLVKGTRFLEVGQSAEDELSSIKIDIFIIENVPDNLIFRYLKGFWCTCLMFMASYEETYENRNNQLLEKYMCKTKEGTAVFKRRVRLGGLFSFFNFQTWMNKVDSALQYNRTTKLMGIPSGRGHYFGEIRSRETFIPVSQGLFEGLVVNLPGNPDDYLSNLYGPDYMQLPPEEKRERHFIADIEFKD